MLRFKNSLEGKILVITGAVVVISFTVAFTINAVTEIESLKREGVEKSRLIGETIERSIRTIMLTGNGDIASQWMDDLRSLNRLKELYVIKPDGMLAFRDLETLIEVNQRLGRELFQRDPLPPIRIMDERDRRLLEVLEEQRGVEYTRKTGDGRVFVQIKPIFNGIKCAKCHSKEEDVLGVLKIATSMREVDTGIRKIVLSAIAGAILSSIAVMGLLWFLLRVFVTVPISKVVDTIKEIIRSERPDKVVPYRSKDEIGFLVENFNAMTRRLHGLYMTLEEKVRERTRELIQAEKMASMGQLAAGLVHEIRNPLGSIKLAIQLMEKELDGSWSEDIQAMSKEIQRIERLLSELLRLARPQPPSFTMVEINEVVERAVAITRKKAESSKVDVVTSFSPFLPKVKADPDLMQQVFLNIMLNAIDAMPDGGRLSITTRNSSRSVTIEFSDTGYGIPKDYIDRIFDPFFTTKGSRGGSGLGLSISYRIVQEHGGEISVRSEEGRGTTFTVRLKTMEGDEADRPHS